LGWKATCNWKEFDFWLSRNMFYNFLGVLSLAHAEFSVLIKIFFSDKKD